jgi:Predicted amidophosphoribosyltransferases
MQVKRMGRFGASKPRRPGVVASIAATVRATTLRAGRSLADVVFPPACLACRKAVGHEAGLCAACWSGLRLIERPFCERLGTPFDHDLGVGTLLSPQAIAEPPVYGRARAVAQFDGPARRLVHRLKYGDRLELADAMGAWMARAGSDLLVEADLLVPIPLHRLRLAERRFNQSALLARAISRRCGVPLDLDALGRRKATPPQVGLTRSQRGLNVQGAFAVEAHKAPSVEDRAIVLVDDVLTSGATANAAARALLRGAPVASTCSSSPAS